MGLFSRFSREARFARKVRSPKNEKLHDAIVSKSLRAWVLISRNQSLSKVLSREDAARLEEMRRNGFLDVLCQMERNGSLAKFESALMSGSFDHWQSLLDEEQALFRFFNNAVDQYNLDVKKKTIWLFSLEKERQFDATSSRPSCASSPCTHKE